MRNCLAIFLLGIWLTLGVWYYVCKVKNLCLPAPEPEMEKTLVQPTEEIQELSPAILKNAYHQVFQMEEDASFQHSTDTINTGEFFENGIDSIVQFLDKFPDTKLIITGYYSKEEENTTSHPNLGLARAAFIKQKVIDRGIEAEQLITVANERDDLFSEDTSYKNLVDFKFTKRYEYLNESDVKSSYRAIDFLEHYSQFFKDGSYIIFSEEPNQQVENLSYYLNRNREHLLRVVVPFQADEANVVDTMDIGLVRALDLKNQLRNMALKEESILISSVQAEGIFDSSNFSLPKVIQYNFVFPEYKDQDLEREVALERSLSKSLSSVVEEESEETYAEITEENEVMPVDPSTVSPLQFNTGSHSLSLTNSVVEYITELKSYLSENPNREVLIIGHTDNVGDPEFNIELGRLRGYEARRLLVNNHISPSRINVISEGEYSPIASNDNSDGRRLNRRVDIDIQ